jgi:hypothetical protein
LEEVDEADSYRFGERHRRYIEKQSLVAYLGKESAAALGLVVPAKAKAGRES